MNKKILSENSSHVYYTDGTVKLKTMKQAKTTKRPIEDSKEGLHTQGEWKIDPILGGTFGYEVVDNNGNTIADCYKNSYYRNRPNGREIGQANAARIVKCVNQHEALVNALRQAIDVIKTWHNADDVWDIYLNNAPEMKSIKQVLNNAKNI